MANKLLTLISTISRHRSEIEAALAPGDREAFFRKFEPLAVKARDQPEAEADTQQQLADLLDQYPQARTVLPAADPAPPAPAGSEPAPPAAAAVPDQAPTTTGSGTPDRPPAEDGRRADGGELATANPAGPYHGAGTPPPHRVTVPGVRSSLALQWTREIVTGVIAMLIVGLTLWVALEAVGLVGDQTRTAAIKDLLTLLLGPLGVVLGFYFGRVPAESHAADATRRADAANTDRDQVRAQAHQVAGELERIERTGQAAAEARGGPVPTTASLRELQAVRDRLRAI